MDRLSKVRRSLPSFFLIRCHVCSAGYTSRKVLLTLLSSAETCGAEPRRRDASVLRVVQERLGLDHITHEIVLLSLPEVFPPCPMFSLGTAARYKQKLSCEENNITENSPCFTENYRLSPVPLAVWIQLTRQQSHDGTSACMYGILDSHLREKWININRFLRSRYCANDEEFLAVTSPR